MKLLYLMILALGSTSGLAQEMPAAVDAAAQHCRALEDADLSGVQDAPTQITHAKLVLAAVAIPTYCVVDGYVAPQVGFQINLPSSKNWNGKILVLGNGGWGGAFDVDACNTHLRRGYACIVSNTGHTGGANSGLWAQQNLAAQIDFGYRATHVTVLVGKAIVDRYYSSPPRRSYFMGCSTGGYEGLVEAQRFPWDFDGIVAGAPDMDEMSWALRTAWTAKNLSDKAGQPVLSLNDVQLLHRAVLDACDKDDGVKDGIIGNPMACRFEPSTLACTGSKKNNCLTQSQVEAVKRIYAGPTTSDGARISTGGVPPGTELYWTDELLGPGSKAILAEARTFLGYMVYGTSPNLKPDEFDFDSDYQRLGLGAVYTDTNPDLRNFKSAGGKLIVYQGGSDYVNPPSAIADYYETTERVMGGRKTTEDFFRLFMVPGLIHCAGGAGADAIDYLTYLERWVEQRDAPDVMIGAHVSESYLLTMPLEWDSPVALTSALKILVAQGRLELPLDPAIPVAFTRPVYPYPDYAVYVGYGDTKSANSFRKRGTAN